MGGRSKKKRIRIKYVKSAIGYSRRQKMTVRALGLRRMQEPDSAWHAGEDKPFGGSGRGRKTMRLHELRAEDGARRRRKRVGRGDKSAGRGTKGQNARSGGGKGPYFEGGQLPLVRRLPYRRGFTNIRRIEYQVVNVERLNAFAGGSTVDPQALVEAGAAKSLRKPIKILGQGELGRSLTVKAHRFSATAREKIEAAGGSIVEIE